MVNEERLHHMIKMAIFDTNQGKECKPMTQYARKDYVSLLTVSLIKTGKEFIYIYLLQSTTLIGNRYANALLF